MANKIDITLAIKGLREGNREGKELEATFDRLKAKGKTAYGLGDIPQNVLKYMAPADLADYQKRLADSTGRGILEGGTKAAFPLAAFINQTMGIGAGEKGRNESFWKSVLPPIRGDRSLQSFINQSLGIGAGQNTPDRKSYQAFWASTVPPVLPPAQTPAWKNFLAAALFGAGGNTFMGGRALLGGVNASSSGGGGGIVTGFLGASAAGGNFLPLAAAMTALKLTVAATKEAFEQLVQAVHRGSQLYLGAAKVGTSTTRLASIQNALTAVGLDPGIAQTLLLNAQFSQRRGGGRGGFSSQGSGGIGASGVRAEIDGEIFGARRGVNQMGELQQLINLEKEYRQARIDTAEASRIEGQTAKALQQLQMAVNENWIQLKGIMANVAFDLSGLLIPAFRDLDSILQSINAHWPAVRRLILDLLPNKAQLAYAVSAGLAHKYAGDTDFGKPLGSGMGLGQFANQWQKIGFVMGGGPSVPSQQLAALHVIANNTGRIYNLLIPRGGGTVMGNPPGLTSSGGALIGGIHINNSDVVTPSP